MSVAWWMWCVYVFCGDVLSVLKWNGIKQGLLCITPNANKNG